MSVAAGDKCPRCHQAIPSAFAAQRSTGCPQAGDWRIRVSTDKLVQLVQPNAFASSSRVWKRVFHQN